MNQGFTIPGHALIIFGMAAIIEQPGKRPFDDPAPGQDGKTGAFFFDDFQVDFVTLLQGVESPPKSGHTEESIYLA